ncbi:hypothetical protein [Sphingobium sp. TKS]|uniref:hypothetical protein n=1 Tax=Sphingobium sp. TKS TaxID=1315974 RepID=UPI00076FF86C|nr:hypothetical protein [Sphingobium sp. TKS]AMK25836.1 hypothetical protein K426_24664 [Sphingobium sp. TKS]
MPRSPCGIAPPMVSTAAEPLSAVGKTPLRPAVVVAVLTTIGGQAAFRVLGDVGAPGVLRCFRLRRMSRAAPEAAS